jgi:hypothetical protein
MRKKQARLNIRTETEKLERYKEAAALKGMSVNDYADFLLDIGSRDDLQERAANARIAALHKESGEALEEATWNMPALAPMPTRPSPEQVQKDPGSLLSWEQYEAEAAAAIKAHRERLQRLRSCTHKGVAMGACCPRCFQVVTRGSSGRPSVRSRFSFHVPHGNGGL